jgi:hypothetical protein
MRINPRRTDRLLISLRGKFLGWAKIGREVRNKIAGSLEREEGARNENYSRQDCDHMSAIARDDLNPA